MKYSININQAGIVDAGYSGKTDVTDWAIIDYIFSLRGTQNEIIREDKVMVNYKHLMSEMPIIGINSKSAISLRIKKLAEIGLLNIDHDEDGRVFASLSQEAIDVFVGGM